MTALNDFNGDGRSDVLWIEDNYPNPNGVVTDWLGQADGSFATNWPTFHAPWSQPSVPIATGDFNGDGYADILVRNNNSGALSEWFGQPNGSLVVNSNFLSNPNPGNSWHIVGTGDFNGDGRSDILWQNNDSTITDWLGQADGSFAGNWNNLHTAMPDWNVIATGDFNGDGTGDMLLRNIFGGLEEWVGQPDGTFVDNSAKLAGNPDPGASWNVVTAADFNGDGRADILWEKSDGTLGEWLGQADGSFVDNSSNMHKFLPSGWGVAASGDFNGDGRDDLLIRNQQGDLREWLGQADGSFAMSLLNSNPDPGSMWRPQDPSIHGYF